MGMEITIDNLEDMCDLMCDNRLPKEKPQTIRQNLNWLLSQYIKELDDLETDIQESDWKIGAVGLISRANVYRKVIQDLQEILEEGEEE